MRTVFGAALTLWSARNLNFGKIRKKMSNELRRSILILLIACLLTAAAAAQDTPAARAGETVASGADEEFLEDLSRRSFLYFWEQSDASTGLTLDRSPADGTPLADAHPSRNVASSAATGFALVSYCIAAERNWAPRADLIERTRRTLDFFANRARHKKGWFYHWMDRESGERRWQSEISSIDTALLLGGVLTVRRCFAADAEIERLARTIYERVDFPWMLDNDPFLFSHGWRPENGFIKYRWNDYSENAILYLLAIGSPTHPVDPRAWYAWRREWVEYAGYRYLSARAPIFIHQYSQAFFDFRGKRERQKGFSVDYHENSARATRAHRACNLNLRGKFPGYTENVWGISAMDSVKGYVVWNCPPPDAAVDGTVAPYVAAASLMFAPDIALPALREMKARYGERIYRKYGFVDAFNPNTDWVNRDVIGIDAGIQLLGIENFRSGNVWRWFMQNDAARQALVRAKIR